LASTRNYVVLQKWGWWYHGTIYRQSKLQKLKLQVQNETIILGNRISDFEKLNNRFLAELRFLNKRQLINKHINVLMKIRSFSERQSSISIFYYHWIWFQGNVVEFLTIFLNNQSTRFHSSSKKAKLILIFWCLMCHIKEQECNRQSDNIRQS